MNLLHRQFEGKKLRSILLAFPTLAESVCFLKLCSVLARYIPVNIVL